MTTYRVWMVASGYWGTCTYDIWIEIVICRVFELGNFYKVDNEVRYTKRNSDDIGSQWCYNSGVGAFLIF